MRFRSFGKPRLTDDAANEILLKSAKGIAVLALLMASQDHTRPRRWIEALLWPDKSPERASGSLRQVLMQMRQSLGKDVVLSDRSSVWLNGIEADLDSDATAQRIGHEFLEGIDIDEPAFNDWLSSMRSRKKQPVADAPEPLASVAARHSIIVQSVMRDKDSETGFLASTLADAFGTLAAEFGEVDIYLPDTATGMDSRKSSVALPETGLKLAIDTLRAGDGISLRLVLCAPLTGRVFWTHHARSDGPVDIDSSWFQEMVFRTVEAAHNAAANLKDASAQAEGTAARALRHMFRFTGKDHNHAETLLEQALGLDPSPRYHIWKAMLHQIQVVERSSADWSESAEKARVHLGQALTGKDQNALISALTAQCAVMVQNDPETGWLHAEAAMRMNPGNPFCHSALASVYLRTGQYQKALAAARHGADLAGATAYAPWWQSLAGLAAMALERHEDAIYHYRKAAMHAPGFRVSLRNLYALYLATKQEEEAARTYKRLLIEEPDFSLQRLKTDPEYPASTLRASSLIGMI